jgi:hypothetical protein
MPPAFHRVLLKLSGEALMGGLEYGTDASLAAWIRRTGETAASGAGSGLVFKLSRLGEPDVADCAQS